MASKKISPQGRLWFMPELDSQAEKSGTKPSLQTRGRVTASKDQRPHSLPQSNMQMTFCMKQKPESWALLHGEKINYWANSTPTVRTGRCLDATGTGELEKYQESDCCFSFHLYTHSESSVAVNNSRAVKTLSDTRTRVQANIVTNKHFL